MRFFYIFVVAALFAVAYAVAEESVSEDINPEKSEISHVREKRHILRKKLLIVGGALLAKKVIAAKVIGAGVLGAGALGAAGLVGAKLYHAKQGSLGGGYGGAHGGGHGGYQSAPSVVHNHYAAPNSVYGSSGPGWASGSASAGYGSSGSSTSYGAPGWSG
ncbi:acanthoscurrin-2-like [Belonocnema kinseyi]|uniref:acanthoscurrin-2-like n=1 Tax=Belonocnema kinseyi TaxID=2817044 RepID=UPI00143DEEF6|nr:acanthoscurrin-2-like [Belonocnema kinseyi]